MKTLNLEYPEKSDIKYTISRFPDGQVNMIIDQKTCFWFDHNPLKWKYLDSVMISSRLSNWLDLEIIVCAVASLREIGVKDIQLYAPYIIGSRSDRVFQLGGNNYLRDVICPVINSLEFSTVTTLDPHSDVLEACIKRFKKESNLELVRFTIRDLCGFTHGRNPKVNDFILVSPDAGASKKIYKLAKEIGYKGDIITCSKDRDTDGNLTKTNVPLPEDPRDLFRKDFIIIDDICDGGATFVNIAKELKKLKVTGKIYLIVTHGIFSKGFMELSEYFTAIYCTTSYRRINTNYLPDSSPQKIVKQLEVF